MSDGPVTLGAVAGLLAELEGEYAASRPTSEALHKRATGPLPGGNSRSQLHFDPFPFYVDSAEGPWLYDVDGHTYLDLVNNYTSLVHGHPTPQVRERLKAQLDKGTAFGTPTEAEVLLAEELVSRVVSIEQVRFTNSGTEACLYAIRAARVFTGRHDLIKAEGGYNGGLESAQVSVKHIGAGSTESVVEPGVHPAIAEHTHIFPFNDTDAAVAVVEEFGPQSAAIIVEPMQGSAGAVRAEPGFLEAIREAATRTGCLLIFDEVMTMRLGYGGLQGELGVTPDLTALGKIIGGGSPVGAFGGRADVMAVTDPRRPDGLMHAGTFNANPLTMAAGLLTLEMLTPEAVADINKRGNDLRDWINTTCTARGLPLVATGYGNLVQLHCSTTPPRSYRESSLLPKEPLKLLFFVLLENGVFAAPARLLMTLTTPMGDEELDKIKAALDSGFDALQQAGYRAT
ncbi:MAG: aspartate aminotransferase family protein [Acidimicrobiia bacterium]|nr:aspartate aminotransferase family protein [Acidimicrobiia bacterium]